MSLAGTALGWNGTFAHHEDSRSTRENRNRSAGSGGGPAVCPIPHRRHRRVTFEIARFDLRRQGRELVLDKLTIRRSAVVFVFAGLILTACGQSAATGEVVGARSAPNQVSGPGGFTFSTNAIALALERQIKEANDLGALPPGTMLGDGVIPLDAILSVKQIERLQQLQSIGQIEVASRLTRIANLRAEAVGDQNMTWGQKSNVTAILDRSAAGLGNLLARINRDRMSDQARADVTAIALFRVRGLLDPQIHLLIAAYDMQQLAVTYGNQRAALQREINAQQLTNPNLAPAQAVVNDMASEINVMLALGQNAAGVLAGLRSADYPGNRGALLSARQTLLSGQSAGARAGAYRRQAMTYLGL
jgi:hypothetical protein